MTGNEYQQLAARTMNPIMTVWQQQDHALHGLVAEVGELHGMYQKIYQGHEFDQEHCKKELGDILWMIAEFCTSNGWGLEEIMAMNIEKLKARYPEGFSEDHSLHRQAVDV